MKKILISTLLLFIITNCYSINVSETKAQQTAVNFIAKNNSYSRSYLFDKIEQKESNGSTLYVVKFKPTGFVVVSGDDRYYPVLYYSLESEYDENNMPDGFKKLIETYLEQQYYIIKNCSSQTNEIKKLWEEYGSNIIQTKVSGVNDVQPLIKTKWNQVYPYNKYCPKTMNGGRTVAGSAAVTLAQYLYFYKEPYRGLGSHSYSLPGYGIISADFENTVYNWSNMADSLNDGSDSSKINEIARLVYHAGVAINTNYGDSISTAKFTSIDTALSKYFDYPFLFTVYINKSRKGYSGKAYTDEEWISMIKLELENKHPVMYKYESKAKGAQIFLIDGLDANNFFHVNWGLGGNLDGYISAEAILQKSALSLSHEVILKLCPAAVKISLKYPENNKSDFMHLFDRFYWNDNFENERSSYKFYIAKDSNFKNIIDDYDWISTRTFSIDPDYNTKYYWKAGVRVSNKDTVWTNTFSFTTAPKSAYKPACTYPNNNQTDVSLSTTIKWLQPDSLSFSLNLVLQVAEDKSFSKIVLSKFVYGLFNSVENLQNNRLYYWRVGVKTYRGDEMIWSDPSTFYTKRNKIEISNNFPNPFNNYTLIKLLPNEQGIISLEFFNSLGQEVDSYQINSMEMVSLFPWKPKNLASGIYFCRIKFNDTEKILKLNYLK